MDNKRFSPEVKRVISLSRDAAVSLGHDYIGTEHLLLGVMHDKSSLAVMVLNSLQVNPDELKRVVRSSVRRRPSGPTPLDIGNLPLNKNAEKVLKVTFLEARSQRSDEILPEHILLSILKLKNNIASKILNQFDVDYEIYRAELEYVGQEKEFTSGTNPFAQSSSESDNP